MAQIAQLKAILADEKKLLGVIREEIIAIADKYEMCIRDRDLARLILCIQ